MADKQDKNDPGREILAAEYAVGVLDLAERAQVRKLMAQDADFAAMVEAWEDRLAALAADVPAIEPPASVRSAVAARLFGAADHEARKSLWHSLALWRPLAIAAVCLLVVSSLFNYGAWQAPPDGPTLIVSLESADTPVRFVALFQPDGRSMRASRLAGSAGPDKDFELWYVPPEGTPRSLGVFPPSGPVAIDLPAGIAQTFAEGSTLAISIEPEGGSPTGEPTGPVVAAGTARPI